jgi:hypothetical protein
MEKTGIWPRSQGRTSLRRRNRDHIPMIQQVGTGKYKILNMREWSFEYMKCWLCCLASSFPS